MGSDQHGDSLALRQRRIPGGAEGVAVFPIEMVVPDGEPLQVLFEVGAEPVGSDEELSAALGIGGAAVEIVVAESVLRDGDGVVLQADVAMIVELRDTGGIVGALIVGLFGEQHVVLAQFGGGRVGIPGGSFVPEGEMTFAAEEVGAENAAVIA